MSAAETKRPDLTAVVPVWDDYVAFLPDCISALPSWVNVVVVDNASNRPLPTLREDISVLRLRTRLSVGAARNRGLERVDTQLVSFLDADDVPLPGAPGRLAAAVLGNPTAVAAIGRLVSWDPATGATSVSAKLPRPITIRAARHRRLFALANVALNTFPIAGGVFRTSAVRAAGGYGDADLGEDWILGSALCFQGAVRLLDEPTMLRRLHGESLWYREHSRAELRSRTAALRRRLRATPSVPAHGKIAASIARPAHELLTQLATRGGSSTPRPPTLLAS